MSELPVVEEIDKEALRAEAFEEVAEFLAHVLPDPLNGERIEVRVFENGTPIARYWLRTIVDVIAIADELGEEFDVHFGVTLKRGKKGDARHATRAKTLWADVDAKCFEGGKAEAREALNNMPLPPSFVVDSGHGYHAYWPLREAIDLADHGADAQSAMRGICEHLSKSALTPLDAVHDFARLLRIPMTLNHKDAEPADVEFTHFNPDLRYELEDFRLAGLWAIRRVRKVNPRSGGPRETPAVRSDVPLTSEEEALIALALRARSGDRFKALWEGRWHDGYKSQSEADFALCSRLAFWTGDAVQMDRLFRISGLWRDKWDEVHDGEHTYGEMTVAKALDGQSEFYSPRANPNAADTPDLPTIVVTHRHLRDLVEEASCALTGDTQQTPLYAHADAFAEIRHDTLGRARVFHLTIPALRGRLDRSANFVRETRDGVQPARPPRDVLEVLEAESKPLLPVLRGIVGTPVFSEDGSLATLPGYQEPSRLFYDPAGEPVPPVPQRPDDADVLRATGTIDEWLVDFPFAEAASRANTIAIGITAVARELIVGPTPLFVIDAPTPGTGKGLLASGMGVVITGSEPSVMAEPRGDEELRKRITALLYAATPVALFDNIKRRVTSAVLAAALTAPMWSDRFLGHTQEVALENRTIWMLTGNNVELDSDIARRTVWVHLDAKADRPWERTSFQHTDLKVWVQEHRQELVWALLVFVQRWIASGRPPGHAKPLGSYEAWSSLVGGVLECVGVEDFMANRDDLYRRVDEETEEWHAFVSMWWDQFAGDAVKTGDLYELALDCAPSISEGSKDTAGQNAFNTRLGKAIAAKRDRRFGDLFVRRAARDAHNGGALWRLELAASGEQAADVELPDPQSSA